MYMLDGGAPFRRDQAGAVFDKRNERMELMGASRQVLEELGTDAKWAQTEVAYVSRTEYPEWAIPCLKTFLLSDEGKSGRSMFDISSYQEIYPGSKVKHFKVIQQQSGVAYADMLFYDNEKWNCTECARLGITSVYTPRGLTKEAWERGLSDFATSGTRSE
ncbi:Magnesium-dependent phosphatase 1 [Tetrabaena socialis]|uniref:Magnesium-dependent phosphatase 1 n=1 Tax=Tetrabaena socialis TaxID=47790 RepID=A0A2J8AEA2_9CHLO|nr:Magnesium-dependent phosphatase 1 [Tetrabaena socialis]|eukprot:PNH10826.1 Magnesium-dependent phosphatase 1 [Tetrabaena socialis]